MARRHNTHANTPHGGGHATPPAPNETAGHENNHDTNIDSEFLELIDPLSLKWIIGVIGIISIIALGAFLAYDPDDFSSEQESVVISQAERPAVYTEPYHLKKDEETRVYIPIYYSTEYSTGNKQYYRKAQNCEWELAGGDIPYYTQSTSAAYVDFKAYDEDMEIVITFTRVK